MPYLTSAGKESPIITAKRRVPHTSVLRVGFLTLIFPTCLATPRTSTLPRRVAQTINSKKTLGEWSTLNTIKRSWVAQA